MSGGDVRPVGRARALWPGSPRRELTMTLLLGAIGAGIIFLATRQTWAQVHTVLPRPLPDSRVSVTGAALVPYADALVVAGLATLAAVLASRRLLRRLAGVLLAAIGAGLAVSAFTLSAAGAESAVSSAVSPETAAAGSVMDGSGTATNTAPDVAGTATHVLFSAAGWQALVVTGALLM
ncbi:MAG: Trp biosynthesis-associated membrane protein, partial [Streptosporangiaceae bacterium]